MTPRAYARNITQFSHLLDLGPSDLVAVRLPPGPAWVALLAEVWDEGPALFPIDNRLPVPEIDRLLEVARPCRLLDETGFSSRPDSVPIDDNIGLVITTSGARGAPKAVELSRASVRASVEAAAARLGGGRQSVALLSARLSHRRHACASAGTDGGSEPKSRPEIRRGRLRRRPWKSASPP
jgi:non-ribosomal peptide synthetase component F